MNDAPSEAATIERPRHTVVLWGVPGTGKSTFARWLRAEKQFQYVDTDLIAHRGPSSPLEAAWVGLLEGRTTAEQFVSEAAAAQNSLVVEFGLYAEQGAIELLGHLRALGVAVLWFDGDRHAAKQAWLSENVKAGRGFSDEKWDEVVALIDTNWHLVAEFFGTGIVRTVEAGPMHVPPEVTYASTLAANEPD